MTKIGEGTLTLTGANTYTGNTDAIPRGTKVNAGTLTVGLGGSITHALASITVGAETGDNAAMVFSGGSVSNSNGIIGSSSGSVGAVTVTSGMWTNANQLQVGRTGTGSLALNGGTVSSNVSLVGMYAGGNGTVTIDGGSLSNESAYFGYEAGSTGTATVTSGTWNNSNAQFVGHRGTGNLTINGGSVSSLYAIIGYLWEASGTATVSNGTWDIQNDLFVGAIGAGVLNVSGGLVKVGGTLNTGAFPAIGNTGNGTVNLSGSGTIETRGFLEAAGTGSINFNGGTLRALANNADFLSGYEAGDVTILGGGAKIDTNNLAIGISTAMGGNGGLTKIGAGTLTLSGANTFAGGTTINAGTLAVSGGAALADTGAVTLANAAGATFNLLNSETIGSLAGGGNVGGNVALNANTLTTGAANTNTTYAGVISGNGGLTKVGEGTLTLSGSNTYTGGTTVEKGTLRLDFSDANAPTSNIVSSASQLVLRGATLEVVGKNNANNSQEFSSLVVGPGASKVSLNANGATFLLLNLGDFSQGSRAVGGTLDLALGDSGRPALVGLVNVPYGVPFGWATVNNGAQWAAFGGATYGSTWAPGTNTEVTGNPFPTANAVTNTLRFNETAANTVTLQGTNVITTGGILITAKVGANLSKITGGAITSGNTENDLIVHQHNTAAALEINSNIVNNGVAPTGLTKSGQGTLILSGTNTYTGPTTVNEGRLVVNSTITGGVIVSNGVFGGNATIHGSLIVQNGGTISPGNSPGTMTVDDGNVSWLGGGNYEWEINSIGGTAGADPGWDLINVTNGFIDIQSTAQNPFNIDIYSLTVANQYGLLGGFNSNSNYIWNIASAVGGINNFDAAFFNLRTNNFVNNFFGGLFSIGVSGNDLLVHYTAAQPIPEPSRALLAMIGILSLAWRRRRLSR